MTVYLDTSCLLKLMLLEPESEPVRRAIATENEVVVSTLTCLEAEVTLKGEYRGGRLSTRQWAAYRRKLRELLALAPFRFATLAGGVFETAIRQNRQAAKTHCRSLDRLHLAAIEELGLQRLMTHDEDQAAAARALGYVVDRPGRR